MQRMLIVEDDPVASAVIRDVAEQCRYDVRELPSGRDFDRVVHDWRPDVYVIDIFVPERDGFELLQILERRREHSAPIIMISSQDELYLQSAENLCRAYGLNIVAKSPKPLKRDQLRSTFDRLIAHAKSKRSSAADEVSRKFDLLFRLAAIETIFTDLLANLHMKGLDPVKAAADYRERFRNIMALSRLPDFYNDPDTGEYAAGEVADRIDGLLETVHNTVLKRLNAEARR